MALLTKRAETVRDDILFSVVIQMCILTMGAMLLDGGQVLQIVGYAAVAYWVAFVLIFVRRGRALTKTDRLLIRWGYLLLTFVSAFVTGAVWNMRGY